MINDTLKQLQAQMRGLETMRKMVRGQYNEWLLGYVGYGCGSVEFPLTYAVCLQTLSYPTLKPGTSNTET
jgi:hypothetical protein